jgi:hypothetical protein
MGKEMADWPFTNATLKPLPTLAPRTRQPMVEALLLLHETTTNNDKHDGTKSSEDATATALLLDNPSQAESPELRGMLTYAVECDDYFKALAKEPPTRLQKWTENPSAPRETLRQWLA